jgi:hypothetical protein
MTAETDETDSSKPKTSLMSKIALGIGIVGIALGGYAIMNGNQKVAKEELTKTVTTDTTITTYITNTVDPRFDSLDKVVALKFDKDSAKAEYDKVVAELDAVRNKEAANARDVAYLAEKQTGMNDSVATVRKDVTSAIVNLNSALDGKFATQEIRMQRIEFHLDTVANLAYEQQLPPVGSEAWNAAYAPVVDSVNDMIINHNMTYHKKLSLVVGTRGQTIPHIKVKDIVKMVEQPENVPVEGSEGSIKTMYHRMISSQNAFERWASTHRSTDRLPVIHHDECDKYFPIAAEVKTAMPADTTKSEPKQ